MVVSNFLFHLFRPFHLQWSYSFITKMVPPRWMYRNIRESNVYIEPVQKRIFHNKQRRQMVCPSQEIQLHKDCVKAMQSVGWHLEGHEWNVIPGKDDFGKGDLVFRNGNVFLVIECKRKQGTKVYEQAEYYAAAWKLRYAKRSPVIYGVWTCHEQTIIGVIRTKEEARAKCKRDVCKLL